MMMKRFSWAIYWVLAVMALLSGVSCTRQDLPGSGVVTVSLFTGLPETRAGTPDPKDGSAIFIDNSTPDLILLIFDADGAKVTPTGEKTESSTATDVKLTYSGIPPGEYTVYALANTAGLWTMSGTLASATTKDEIEALYFTELPSVPDPDTFRMPLTAKGTLSVNAAGNGDISLNLTRPVARVVLKFENNSGYKLKLDPFSATFKKMAPSEGYLFQHNPDVPSGVAYGDLAFTAPASGLEIESGASYSPSALVYPGLPGYPNVESYLCDISFTITEVIDDDSDRVLDPSYSTFTFTDLRVHNNRGEDIKTLARNQQLTVTVKVSLGKMLSFNFEVGDWTTCSETVTFD